jgi:3-hydroxyacyl-[acyl-carrier-protein] dehydratase
MATILLDHFYTINQLDKTDTVITANISFDPDHPIFGGHFPDMPVVPGVCQAQILGEVLSQALENDFQLKTASSIKFLAVVDPKKNPSLDIVITWIKNGDDFYSVSAQYKSDETIVFKFKGIYG